MRSSGDISFRIETTCQGCLAAALARLDVGYRRRFRRERVGRRNDDRSSSRRSRMISATSAGGISEKSRSAVKSPAPRSCLEFRVGESCRPC